MLIAHNDLLMKGYPKPALCCNFDGPAEGSFAPNRPDSITRGSICVSYWWVWGDSLLPQLGTKFEEFARWTPCLTSDHFTAETAESSQGCKTKDLDVVSSAVKAFTQCHH